MRPPQQHIRAIMQTIEKVIAEEPRPVAYTDAEIAEQVNNVMGWDAVLANRVWYYRQDLGIPSSGKRRKAYKRGIEKT